MKNYKAALLGYYGFDNFGDELLLQACLNILRQSGVPREKIIVFSNKPDETSQNFCVDSINRWHYRKIWRVLTNCESLILGGGGLFQDSTSVKSCAWYWLIMRLAKLAGLKIFALGQSIGPLKYRISRIFTGNALRLCKFIHVRDDNSRILAEKFRCANIIKGSDAALTLKPEKMPRTGSKLLVNLRPCKNLDSFVKIILPYVNNYTGEKIGVALSPEDECALKFLSLSQIIRVKNFHDAFTIWDGAGQALGMRLHFGVLSRIFATPLALMPYDVKVSEFAKESGVPCIIDKWENPLLPHIVKFSHYDKICSWINAELMKSE